MDISKHIILEEIHEAGVMLESFPASEQQTKLSEKLSDIMIMADTLVDACIDEEPIREEYTDRFQPKDDE